MTKIPPASIPTESLKFLAQLKKNNHKEFMDANRDTWDSIRKAFCHLVDQLSDALSARDASVSGQSAKTSVFRINRDIRFSKNKEPYKTHLSAFICKGGKKSGMAGYYLHLEPGNKSFAAAGIYQPPTQSLYKVRSEIDYNGQEFEKILKAAAFRKHFGKLDEEFLAKRFPRGFDPQSPYARWIQYTSYLAVSESMKDKEVLSPDLLKKVQGMFLAAIPLNQFLNQALDEQE